MWWILLLLPTVVWALPPSPNAISILPNGVCGNQFACKPTSQCSVWYAESNALPPKPCSDPRGVVGLCCPDVVHVKCKLNCQFLLYR
jgi:hypothetical protein